MTARRLLHALTPRTPVPVHSAVLLAALTACVAGFPVAARGQQLALPADAIDGAAAGQARLVVVEAFQKRG